MTETKNTILPAGNLIISIKYALIAEHDHNWYEVKVKSEYAIFLILEGSIHIEYMQKRYTLKPGDIFLFYPQILYQASSPSPTCSFIFIHFDAILGTNHQALNFYPFDGQYSAAHFGRESDALRTAFFSAHKKEPFSELNLTGSLMSFLAIAMKAGYEASDPWAEQLSKSTLAKLQPALIYIGEHIHEPIHIQNLADCVNLSEKYFITFFKNAVGITPANYIFQAKMKKALEYLHEQKYSVKEVASLIGYSDIYTFSKAFKKAYGVSPTKI